MKQLWFGVGILAVLLAVSLGLGAVMEEIHLQSSADLEKAAASALEGDWALASALSARAKKDWSKHRNITAAVVSHAPLDQIDTDFSQLEIFAARENPVQYSITCRRLSLLLESIPQSHRFSWWNLL